MNYLYQYLDTGEEFELSHSIVEPARTSHDGRPCQRLISAESGGFRLVPGPAGSWGSGGYALTPAQRKAEAKLGRRVIKRA